MNPLRVFNLLFALLIVIFRLTNVQNLRLISRQQFDSSSSHYVVHVFQAQLQSDVIDNTMCTEYTEQQRLNLCAFYARIELFKKHFKYYNIRPNTREGLRPCSKMQTLVDITSKNGQPYPVHRCAKKDYIVENPPQHFEGLEEFFLSGAPQFEINYHTTSIKENTFAILIYKPFKLMTGTTQSKYVIPFHYITEIDPLILSYNEEKIKEQISSLGILNLPTTSENSENNK